MVYEILGDVPARIHAARREHAEGGEAALGALLASRRDRPRSSPRADVLAIGVLRGAQRCVAMPLLCIYCFVERIAYLGTGPLLFDGGTLQALATGPGITSAKAITLNAGGGTFLADAGTISTLSGAITGRGRFTKSGLGLLKLSGSNFYSGNTTISAERLKQVPLRR